jgi:hypothetical protein
MQRLKDMCDTAPKPQDHILEHWMRRELAAAYDATLTERLPDDWIVLITRGTQS